MALDDKDRADLLKMYPELPDYDLERLFVARGLSARNPTPQEVAFYFGYFQGLISRLCYELHSDRVIMHTVADSIEKQNKARAT